MKKAAFTLAEVLITIGIIGVVAAITIPGLITSYQKNATAVKVEKFYSMINQAVRLSMVDNGEPKSWDLPEKAFHYTSNVNYFNQYFAPYLKASSYKKVYIPAHENSLAVALSDGGAFMLCRQETTVAFFYLTNYSDLDKPNFYKDNKKFFEFQMGKISTVGDKSSRTDKNYIVPFTYTWDGTHRDLINNRKYGCSKNASNRVGFCAKLLQENNWRVPHDYPW